ncbi:MAG TPA: fumarate hydratase [Microthrixaceae bacterium]|nr:fumarate hydratase [Microthrixaceae bacterium]HMU79404.1 fumarate hydratase [Microthrixaceae bacterium]HNK37674.1 fumarate hydratase [Microthrixaceae bacterium]HNL50113.1 fumarate hydratase [Microthrixaceae bacterium]HNO45866.1 fumarate hydratase [Microthrixaceae bacterium]
MVDFAFQEMFPQAKGDTPYRQLTSDFVEVDDYRGQRILRVDRQALTLLAAESLRDIAHLFRPGHLAQLAKILDDPEATENDRFVARTMLQNACVSAGMVLPSCQDTGTAIVMGKKGQQVWTHSSDGAPGGDEEALARGVFRTYTESNLRYSQVVPITTYDEVNTGTNLPAQIDLMAVDGDEYHFLVMAKGGGSANKTFLFQETKALLNPESLMSFVAEKIRTLGTSACPPYHLAIVIGGTSAEMNLKTVKLASARYLDGLPTEGNGLGHAIRDPELEADIWRLAADTGIGAQFGGKYFVHDVRVIRLPRHGASCPVGIGVSCSADRQSVAKITEAGVFVEQLETDPAQYLPEVTDDHLADEVVHVDLNRPMEQIRAELSRYPIRTRLSLSGPMVVARDIAHAKLKERIERGEGLPQYVKDHPIYYAGPAKTPDGMASGSFGPTTAGRMDSYVDLLMANGGSFVTLAKGNRSAQVRRACQTHGGFYLGSIGGPAAILAQDAIKHVEVLEYPELGMEAIWRIEVEDFPAFIITDDKGNDFFADLL